MFAQLPNGYAFCLHITIEIKNVDSYSLTPMLVVRRLPVGGRQQVQGIAWAANDFGKEVFKLTDDLR